WGSHSFVGLAGRIDFVADDRPARNGYTRVRVDNVAIADGEGLESDDYDIDGDDLRCDGIDFLDRIFAFLPGLLADQVNGVLSDTLDEQLCTRRGIYGCPTGTYAVPDDS